MDESTIRCVYLIPAGFTGWAMIEFAVAGAPPLSRDDGARRVELPASGRLATSSPQETGIVDLRFFAVDAAGARTPIDVPDAHHDADPNAAWKAHDHDVVLGFHTGDATDAAGRRHYFEGFYVGRGPAGDPPTPAFT